MKNKAVSKEPFKHVDQEDVSINIAPTEEYFFKKYMDKVEKNKESIEKVERVQSAKMSSS